VFGGWTKAQQEHFSQGGHFRPDLQELIELPGNRGTL
jgi:ABC-type sulfate transport system substrate-binding protein